jgi:hypothetical protein
METQEVWKNSIPGSIVIQRSSPNGIVRHELIASQRSFSISPEDRRMNQNLAANSDLDMFANGMLQPVNLPDTTEPELLENPNHIPDSQLPAFFRMQIRTFTKRIETITNQAMLERLKELGPGQDATVRQMEMIQARLDAVSPKLNPGEDETDEQGFRRVRPVSPR